MPDPRNPVPAAQVVRLGPHALCVLDLLGEVVDLIFVGEVDPAPDHASVVSGVQRVREGQAEGDARDLQRQGLLHQPVVVDADERVEAHVLVHVVRGVLIDVAGRAPEPSLVGGQPERPGGRLHVTKDMTGGAGHRLQEGDELVSLAGAGRPGVGDHRGAHLQQVRVEEGVLLG
jgi:hypothetical protein